MYLTDAPISANLHENRVTHLQPNPPISSSPSCFALEAKSKKESKKKSRKKHTNTHKQNTVAFLIKCKQFTFIEIRLICETRKSSEKRQKERSVFGEGAVLQTLRRHVWHSSVQFRCGFVVAASWNQADIRERERKRARAKNGK